MIFRQVIHDDLGCASYFLADDDGGEAAVVDPKLDVEPYLALARYTDTRITHVLETHVHADHVSGHGRLAEATGATIHVHRDGAAEHDHEPFDDGWELELGSLVIRAMHTPGHRPEHTSFLLTDRARSDSPWAVLTGDALFVGEVGRPDLAVDPEEGARESFASLHDRLLDLPAHTEVWPGHLGGSLCGGPGMDRKVASSIGFERANNVGATIADRDDFVAAAVAALGPQPPRFEEIVAVNRGAFWSGAPLPRALTPHEIDAHREGGALVVDVRTDLQFDEAHIPGSVSNTAVRAGFGSKLAWIVEGDQEVVLVGRDSYDALHAAELAGAVAVKSVVGYLDGGMTSWREEGRPVSRIERVDVRDLHDRLGAGDAPQLVDVREQSEWDEGHLPGSIHAPYHGIHSLPEELDPDREVVALCASGQRAGLAASLLQRLGASHVVHAVGGGVGTLESLGTALER